MKQLSLERLASKSNAVVGWSVLSHPTRLHEIGGFSVGSNARIAISTCANADFFLTWPSTQF